MVKGNISHVFIKPNMIQFGKNHMFSQEKVNELCNNNLLLLLFLVFQCTDKHAGNREVITQTSVQEPSSEDNSLGYKGKLIMLSMDYN